MMKLADANKIIEFAFSKGEHLNLQPLSVCVLDAGGHVIAFQRQDSSSMLRFEIARGKAYAALSVGKGSRWLEIQAASRPHFLLGLSGVSQGRIVPVTGGVLVKSVNGELLGAVGISGDTSDNDEACAVYGVTETGFAVIAD